MVSVETVSVLEIATALSAGGWALAGFLFLALGEVAREASSGAMSNAAVVRLLLFLSASFALAVALTMHLGWIQ